jgi:hypothetical protein
MIISFLQLLFNFFIVLFFGRKTKTGGKNSTVPTFSKFRNEVGKRISDTRLKLDLVDFKTQALGLRGGICVKNITISNIQLFTLKFKI